MQNATLPSLPCLCGNLRRAARAITQLYEEALRSMGLRSSQFTILQALSQTGEVSQGKLGEVMAMDSTTLTRTLGIMLRHGWVAERPGKDRRERWLSLSAAGRAQLRRALPAWEKVQSRVRKRLGEPGWQNLFHLTTQISSQFKTEGEMS